jgi:hypothetical protein
VQRLMKMLLVPLMGCALIGLVLSLSVHLSSLAGSLFEGIPQGLAALRLAPTELLPLFFALHAGIFLVWTPMILVLLNLSNNGALIKSRKSMDLTSPFRSSMVIFSGCPAWMKYLIKGLYFYFWPNFLGCVLFLMGHGKQPATWVGGWIFFSAGWMLGYAAGLAMLITIYRQGISPLERYIAGDASSSPWG